MTGRGPTVADALLLLAVGADGTDTTSVGYALAGAQLTELVLAGRLLTTTEKAPGSERVEVADPSPTGRDDLDAVLERITRGRRRSVADWVSALSGSVREPVEARLLAAGELVREPTRWLGLAGGGLRLAEPGRTREIVAGLRAELDGAPAGGGDRSVALLGLLDAAGLVPVVLAGVDPEAVAARLHAAGDDPATAGVRGGIAAVRTAVDAVRSTVTLNTTTFAPSNTIIFGNNG